MNDPAIFDEFLASGTVRSTQVELYADQDAGGELEAVAVEAARDDLSDDEAERLLARLHELRARWDASKATFTIQRLTDPIREQLEEEFPAPKAPRPVGAGATEKRKAEYEAAVSDFQAAKLEWAEHHTLAVIAYSITRAELSSGTYVRELRPDGRVETPALTTDQVMALVRMPYGPQWLSALRAGLEEVSSLAKGSVDIPFLRGASGSVPA